MAIVAPAGRRVLRVTMIHPRTERHHVESLRRLAR
jgi:hypothetical protein